MKKKIHDRVDSKNDGNIDQIYGIPLFGRPKSDLLKILSQKNDQAWLATVNPEFIMNALKDKNFLDILLSKTAFNVVDGVGLIWAQKVLSRGDGIVKRLWWGLIIGVEIIAGKHRETLITGADLMDDLCAMAAKQGKTVFFYGGWDDRSQRTAKYFLNKYPALKVVGAQPENFDFETKVDMLFVARAMKKQELWIDEHLKDLKVKLVMGVGRSFDYYSGDLTRAPMWVRKIGFEWLFSLIVEPKRWKRQLDLPKFIWKVITE